MESHYEIVLLPDKMTPRDGVYGSRERHSCSRSRVLSRSQFCVHVRARVYWAFPSV